MLKGIQTRSDAYRDWCERVEQVLEGVGIDKTGMAPPGNHIHVPRIYMCGVLLCLVCLTLLVSSFSSLIKVCIYIVHVHVHKKSRVLCTSV